MDDALAVGVVQGGGQPRGNGQLVLERQRGATPEQRVQRLARHVLHGQERPAVAVAHVIDGDDAWIVQHAGDFRLPLEARQAFPPLGLGADDVHAHHLHRQPALDARVLGQVHRAHGPRSQQGPDRIPADGSGQVFGFIHEVSPYVVNNVPVPDAGKTAPGKKKW